MNWFQSTLGNDNLNAIQVYIESKFCNSIEISPCHAKSLQLWECCTPQSAWYPTHCDVIFHTTCPIVSVANLQIYPQSWMMRKVGTYFSHDFECMKLVYVYSIEKYNDFVFKLVLNQLFWFLAASLAASLAALAALWAITRSLRISTSASPWRNISLILRVSCWAASVRLTTSAYSLCSLSNIDGNWF